MSTPVSSPVSSSVAFERRSFLKTSLLSLPALPALLGGSALGSMASSAQADFGALPSAVLGAKADDAPLADAVTQGVAYFQKRCEDQLPLVRALQATIASGDVAAAKHAYIESRPPYEEIETTANCFMDTDADIDARPYAFAGGETDPDFRGFHKIEAMIFAYEDLAAAAPYAAGLVASVVGLQTQLAERERFSATKQFDGMIALATEVAAKKVSSEEETWSDQSLLIFRHNWTGIASQFAPFASILGAAGTQTVNQALASAMALVMPHATEGQAAMTPYSSIGIAERRRMADASNTVRDALVAARATLGI